MLPMLVKPTTGNLVVIDVLFCLYTFLLQKLYKAKGTIIWLLILNILQFHFFRGLFPIVSHNSYREAKYNALTKIIYAKCHGK